MVLQLQNMEEDDFSDVNYFEDLKESLEEVLAFEKGEPNKCKVRNREIPWKFKQKQDEKRKVYQINI